MNVHDIRVLFAYNAWANERILSAAEPLSSEQFASASLGYCKLHETLVHIVSSEWAWRSRWQGTSPAAMLDAADFPTLATVRERWDNERQQMNNFLDTLGDADLQRSVEYTNFSGQAHANILWHMMTHMVTHGMQHRGELAMLLTELGFSPGSIDLITFVREQQ